MRTNLVEIKDYRNTSFVNNDFAIGNKKNEFMKKFRQNHPRVRNIHSTVKNRDNIFNGEFRKLYFEKCAYCGLSTQVIGVSSFEVDHVIPASILKLDLGYTYEYINGIDNLVNSCQMCNRGKTNYFCKEEYYKLLHPDSNNLPTVFERTEEYSIEISTEYESDSVIREFYTQLKLNNQLRRLDYLLMEMKDFCDKNEGEAIIDEMQKLIIKIENKRRKNY